ncbi:hypothetical protein BZL29_1395 [Mycobacterium kansasii]|uniref:Uncharacterized protein n=1 Tax=Mycobacterium kansasii TaxID=1768 RepID=A0A1V3XXQ3_MYCKA|nr:hypothetical protein BZL29_1395 [Mycobacterium kansasii]
MRDKVSPAAEEYLSVRAGGTFVVTRRGLRRVDRVSGLSVETPSRACVDGFECEHLAAKRPSGPP